MQKAVLKHHPSLVIIMIGTNDMINPPKMLTYDEYSEKLTNLVRLINSNGSRVLLLSLPYVDTATLFKRRGKHHFDDLPNSKIDSANKIIHRIAREQNCLYLDINKIFTNQQAHPDYEGTLIRNKENSGKNDGVHPTPEGYQLIAESVFHFLENQRTRFKKIICFGDSITFGAYVKGSGRTKGDTYPAVLKRLLTPL